MLDYIGGDIIHITSLRSGHQVVLQHCHTDDGEAVQQPFHVRGSSPGETGDRLVVMLLEDEVAGWHNQATGEQGHLLHALPRLRWRLRDVGIATVAPAVLYLAGKPLLGLAAGLGWLVSVMLWRTCTMHDVRRDSTSAGCRRVRQEEMTVPRHNSLDDHAPHNSPECIRHVERGGIDNPSPHGRPHKQLEKNTLGSVAIGPR